MCVCVFVCVFTYNQRNHSTLIGLCWSWFSVWRKEGAVRRRVLDRLEVDGRRVIGYVSVRVAVPCLKKNSWNMFASCTLYTVRVSCKRHSDACSACLGSRVSSDIQVWWPIYQLFLLLLTTFTLLILMEHRYAGCKYAIVSDPVARIGLFLQDT